VPKRPTTRSVAIYQLKAVLLDIQPQIWRRLEVPRDVRLAKLHRVLQSAFGWEECHLHEFQQAGRRVGMPDPDLLRDPEVEDDRKVKLSQLLKRAGDRLVYRYDFGDRWEHLVELEQVLEPAARRRYPRRTGGERSRPPEDCGGPLGYTHFVEAMANHRHRDHKRMAEWIGGVWDPEAFDLRAINADTWDWA
jgi:hypothetical protein